MAQHTAKDILDRWATAVVPKEAIWMNGEVPQVDQNKTQHYEERGYKGDEVLWIPPKDCVRFEFEEDKNTNHRFILEIESAAKSLGFDYCITGHGGKSDYVNMFNLKGLPLGEENQNAKLLLADLLMPTKAKKMLDRTNLGWTLSPVIGHEHWKPKYNGAIHKLMRGKHPLEHKNEYPKELLKQLKKSRSQNKIHLIHTKQNSSWVESFLLEYCCKNPLPKGARHYVIEKNLAAYIMYRNDKEAIKTQYYEAQGRTHDSMKTWELAILQGDYGNVSAGELANFIKEYNLPFEIPKSQKEQNIYVKPADSEYKPVTLEECKKVVYSWLSIEDKEVLDTVFAFTLSEKLGGDPLWLFLVAPPGGCKTELLRAINGGDFFHLSDLTSKTFVSGLMVGQGEEREKIDDLLPQLNKKILLFKDFTTILEKQKDERREIIAQLREIYDGFYSKKFGTLDFKVEYESRFGFIAGVTPIIDKHWKVMQQLGERFLKYRWEEDSDRVTRQAEKDEGRETPMRKEIKDAVMGFLTNLKITELDCPDEFIEPIISAAKFLAVCRTPVTIHSGQSDFYYDFIPTPEKPTRLVKQLKKLSKALACVRGHKVVEYSDVKSAIKVALSTAPQDRLKILQAIQKLENNTLDGCTITQIKHEVALPETSIRNICMQLEVLRMVEITNISRENDGYRNYVSYYKLQKNIISALSPVSFLETSKKVGGYSAGKKKGSNVSSVNMDSNSNFPLSRPDGKRFRRVDPIHLPCVSCGAKSSNGWNLEDEQGKAPYCDACAGQL